MVMFGVGPAYLLSYGIDCRWDLMRSSWQFWLSAMATNLAIAIVAATMIWLVGIGRSCCAIADHDARGFDWRLVVLRPASVRGHLLGP